MTPWTDKDLHIVALNDAYALNIPRYDEWYELHPLDQMWFRKIDQRTINPNDVPKGFYIRPQGHLEWLKAQAARVPVWLQSEPPADWPANAQRLPVEELERKYFGGAYPYWASGPAFMLLHLHARGFREIHVYGIHLATEAEYREQRPNFEALIRSLLGAETHETRADGIRTIVGKDMTIVLPEAAPILQHGWKYAYEHKPEPKPNPYRDELKRTVKAKNTLVEQLIVWPVDKPKTQAIEQLQRLAVIEEDCQMQLQRQAMAEQYGPIRAVLGA